MLKKVLILGLLALARPLEAATITVNSFAQDGPGCTIANAIEAAERDVPVGEDGFIGGVEVHRCTAGSGADVIKIRAGTYTINNPAVLDPNGDSTAFPIITTPITIDGDGPGATIIERAGSFFFFRFFRVQTAVFEIRDLTLKGGNAGPFDGGAIYVQTGGSLPMAITARNVNFEDNRAEFGGAIADLNNFTSFGVTFTLEDCVFLGNRASLGGAIAVSPFGDLVLARRSRFEDNRAPSGGGAIYARPTRGAVINAEDTVFVGNEAMNGAGGAIHSWDVQLTRVSMVNNQAGDGGALDNYEGVATIIDSSFEGNGARRGGAIFALGRLLVSGSTFTENEATAHDGGAIFLDDRTGASRITNSTFSANHAYVEGTAISVVAGGLTLINDTIVGNTSTGNWGPAVRAYWGDPTIRISNSIIAGNMSFQGTTGIAADFPFDVYGDENPQRLISLGHNLFGSGEYTDPEFLKPGDQAGTVANPLDPGLLPLGQNGGPTETHALAPGSLALDHGSEASPGTDDACEAVDQRGLVRPGPGPGRAECDIGAFEFGVYHTLTLTVGAGGSVAGMPGATACTGTCSVVLGVDSVVTLTAGADAGWAFTGWTGACSGASPTCEVTLDGAKTVAASFAAAGGATTTSLTSSPNPSTIGTEVTFTAVVSPTPPGVGTPTGRVTFLETTTITVLGQVTLNASGVATFPTSALPQGVRTIQALYLGDGLFATSTDGVTHTVTGPTAATSTALTSSPNPSVSGEPVTLTATVAALSGTGTPGGMVSFVHAPSGTVLGSALLMVGGTATITTSTLPEGTFDVRAIYGGNLLFSGSADELPQVVSPAPSTPIRNGEPESRAQFNAVGMILPGPGHAACTGTLVSPSVVLTAAHCLLDDSPNPIFEFSLGPGRTARVIDTRVPYRFRSPNGSVELVFDVALLSLDRAATASWTDIVPATLRADVPSVGVEATAVGFGPTRTSGSLIVTDYIPGETQRGIIEPQAFLETVPGSADQMFCPVGAGGPLFYENQIVGVASFRFVATCAEPGPGYYVNVRHVADWIQAKTADLESGVDYTLTVTVGEGGSVVSDPPGIDCAAGQTCTAVFEPEQFVYLSAIPGSESTFIGWVGGICEGAGTDATCLVMTENAQTQIGTATFRIDAVNDAPVNSVPGPQSVNAGAALVFSSAAGNQISVTDTDDADNAISGDEMVLVTLTAPNATLTLSAIAGLTFHAGINGQAAMTVSGTLTNINNALNGLSYTPVAGFTGVATLAITTDDLGNFGAGGALTDTDPVPITVVLVQHTLTVTVGAGGSVVSSPAGINCSSGQTCTAAFDQSAVVTLAAQTWAPNAVFMAWGGACQGTDACVVTVDAPKTVSATFGYPVTISLTGARTGLKGVSMSPPVIGGTFPGLCVLDTCTANVPSGSTVTLSAFASPPVEFVRWVAPNPCGDPRDPRCEFIVTAPTAITARFRRTQPEPGSPIARINGPATLTMLSGVFSVAGLFDGSGSLDPNGNGSALSYEWSVDGQPAAALVPSILHANLPVGTHVISLTVTDVEGLTGTATKTVAVSVIITPPSPTLHLPTSLVLEATNGFHVELPPGTVTATFGGAPIPFSCWTHVQNPFGNKIMNLVLGVNTVRCEAGGGFPQRYTSGTFTVTVTAPLALSKAQALLAATEQTPGATNGMENHASKIVSAIENAHPNKVCPALTKFNDAVAKARQQNRILAREAQALLARSADFGIVAACEP